MAWLYLLLAGIFEIIWATSLKYTCGFTKLTPSVITILTMTLSVYFLSIAVKSIPIGTAYVIWTGIGAIGVVITGILLFNESVNIVRILCIFLIIAGIVGLKLSSINISS